MPECDTRIRGQGGLTNSRTWINRRVNAAIARARAAAGGNVTRMIELVYRDLGASVSSNPLSNDFNKSGLEVSGDRQPISVVLPLRQSWTKFSGFTSPLPKMWASNGAGFSRTLSPTVNVGGIYIGLDKLGHFMQQGHDYYDMIARRGRSLRQAREWGHQTEAAGAPGSGIPPYGINSTRVYSMADKEANLQGYYFYAWLATNPTLPFDIATYVNRKWSEEHNVSSYHGDLAPIVWTNLLRGTWTGQFTINNDPNNPAIAIRALFQPGVPSLAGTPVSGSFNYTYTSGRVRVRFNGNIQFIPFISKSLGYRGIRIDYSWRSGQNSGRGVWRSGYSENQLSGTWGWNLSHNNGGRFTLQRP